MKTKLDPSPELEPDLEAEYARMPKTDPEYGIWLNEHPEFMLAMLKEAQRLFDEKHPSASPEDQRRMKAAHEAFKDEMSSCYVVIKYNEIADRMNRVNFWLWPGSEDLEDIQSCRRALAELMDVALDIFEPERTQIMVTMTQTQEHVRRIFREGEGRQGASWSETWRSGDLETGTY